MRVFRNEPFLDFSKKRSHDKMKEALCRVKGELGRTYPLIIGGKALYSSETFSSVNPAQKTEVIGIFQEASEAFTEKAVEVSLKAFETWQWVSPKKRANYLIRIAALIRKKRFDLCAWLAYEAGKNWREADGEVAEAIDFCEYYARELLRLTRPPKLAPLRQEKNKMIYIPLGVGAVITPWNFPLAILIGMTVSAIVTGNTVVVKPSEFGPSLAFQFMEMVKAVGIPDGVINLLTGRGARVGSYLVNHPRIRFISFTGSKKVGIEISEHAAKVVPGQKWMKRVILEMGGKDGIVVDNECNLDEAVEGVVKSAFGYQGQKCSACSRAIVDEKIYHLFVEKLLNRVKSIRPGSPDLSDSQFGPLISEAALNKAQQYIDIGKQEGQLLCGGEVNADTGFFLDPTIFGDISPEARLAQEEIFAPILSIIKAKDFDDALRIANNTEYGLTGAFYTRNRKKLEKGIKTFHVGNLYVNRGCTGALVGAHPFGGFNMSGTDSKAGGPDYLFRFLQAKSISERKTS